MERSLFGCNHLYDIDTHRGVAGLYADQVNLFGLVFRFFFHEHSIDTAQGITSERCANTATAVGLL